MAQAESSPNTDCPVARLATEAARILTARRVLDGQCRTEEMDIVEERLEAVQKISSFERCSSPLGAFYQALLIHNEMDGLAMVTPPAKAETLRMLRRLASSVASFAETASDAETVKVLRHFYLSNRWDDLNVVNRLLDHPRRAL